MRKFNTIVGGLCAFASAFAWGDSTSLSSMQACRTTDTIGPYMKTIEPPTAKEAGFKCRAPSSYVEILTGAETPLRFCTVTDGLLPAGTGKDSHVGGYRIDMVGYLHAKVAATIRGRMAEITDDLKKDKEVLDQLLPVDKEGELAIRDLKMPDGTINTGVLFSLLSKIPSEYHSHKEGSAYGRAMDTLNTYRSAVKAEFEKLTAEAKKYEPENIDFLVQGSASNFAELAQYALSDCPRGGRYSNSFHSCVTPSGDFKHPMAKEFANEMTAIQEQDALLDGSALAGLRVQGLFQQGSLSAGSGPRENYLACNEFFQSFGVTRVGCKSTAVGDDCRVLVEGAAVLDPNNASSAALMLGDNLFNGLPDAMPIETVAASHAKSGDTAVGTSSSSKPATSSGRAAEVDSNFGILGITKL